MLWPLLHEKAREQQLPLAIVAAEALHLVILESLFSRVESQKMAFQGGTCIHLIYGGCRYSEDLDFAGENLDWDTAQRLMVEARSSIEKATMQLLGVGQCEWRFPQRRTDRRVHAYWFLFQPQGQRQKYRVKVEFGRYPVYQTRTLTVRSDLDVMQRMPLVTALSSSELLAEKVAAVAGRPYIKGRDLFDLWYLAEVLRSEVDLPLLEKKWQDYHVAPSVRALRRRLASYQAQALTAEMERFLPERYRRQLHKDDYGTIRQRAMAVMEQALMALRGRKHK